MALKAVNYSYVFNQATAATTWNIQHNLNTTSPIIDVWYNNAGVMTRILPASTQVVDSNNVTLTFSTAVAGVAKIV